MSECSVLIDIIKGFEETAKNGSDLCNTKLNKGHKTCQILKDFYDNMKLLRIETESKCPPPKFL